MCVYVCVYIYIARYMCLSLYIWPGMCVYVCVCIYMLVAILVFICAFHLRLTSLPFSLFPHKMHSHAKEPLIVGLFCGK